MTEPARPTPPLAWAHAAPVTGAKSCPLRWIGVEPVGNFQAPATGARLPSISTVRERCENRRNNISMIFMPHLPRRQDATR